MLYGQETLGNAVGVRVGGRGIRDGLEVGFEVGFEVGAVGWPVGASGICVGWPVGDEVTGCLEGRLVGGGTGTEILASVTRCSRKSWLHERITKRIARIRVIRGPREHESEDQSAEMRLNDGDGSLGRILWSGLIWWEEDCGDTLINLSNSKMNSKLKFKFQNSLFKNHYASRAHLL